MTEFNVRADYLPAPEPTDLADDIDALLDLHVAITEYEDGGRSYTLTVDDAPNAWSATAEAVTRLADVGASTSRLLRLDVLPTAEFDLREGLEGVA